MTADMRDDPIARRVANIRLSAAIVLAGFLLNAGLVVLLVSFISRSVLIALATLGVMGAFVLIVAVFTEWFLLNATGARPLLAGEFPWLLPMVHDLAEKAGIAEPRVLVSDQNALNAYTTGSGDHAKMVLYTRLIHELPREQVRAVAAHELGHILNRDISLAVWTGAIFSWVLLVKTLAVVVALFIFEFFKALPGYLEDMGPLGAFVGILLAAMGFMVAGFIWIVAHGWAFVAQLMQLALTRQREYLADATGAAITGEPSALAHALASIAVDPSIGRGAGLAARFCIVSPAVAGGWWDEMLSTHPSTERRIEELSKLPAGGGSPAARDWPGIGSLSLFLPAGTIVLVALLALSIPLLIPSLRSEGPSTTFAGPAQNGAGSRPPLAALDSTPNSSRTPSATSEVLGVAAPTRSATPTAVSPQTLTAVGSDELAPADQSTPHPSPGQTTARSPTPTLATTARQASTATPPPSSIAFATPTATHSPTATAVSSSTLTPSPIPSGTPTPTPTPSPVPTATSSPTRTPSSVPAATLTSTATSTPVPLDGNVARSASIDWAGDNPSLLVDGNLGTYSTGANLVTFTWSRTVSIHRVIIWNDRSRGGINWLRLVLSDGTSFTVDYGGPNECVRVDFGARTVDRVQLDFYDHDGALALKEIEIWATTGPQSSGNSCGNSRSF
jgi:heat shock protein HtpX